MCLFLNRSQVRLRQLNPVKTIKVGDRKMVVQMGLDFFIISRPKFINYIVVS